MTSIIIAALEGITRGIVYPLAEFIWRKFEPHYEISKKVTVGIFILLNVIGFSFGLSAFVFGTFYFNHMPTVFHSYPIHFQYNRSCIEGHNVYSGKGIRPRDNLYSDSCYPTARLQLASPERQMIQEGQPYSVVIQLELPESPTNLEMGMFMIHLSVQGRVIKRETSEEKDDREKHSWYYGKKSKYGPAAQIEASRSTAIKYKSPILRSIYMFFFWPLMLADFEHETQHVSVILFNELMLQKKSLDWTATVRVDHPALEIYSGKLDFTAKFQGIQYLLYRWPILSFAIGTMLFFLPIFFVISVTSYFCIWKRIFSEQSRDRWTPRRRRSSRRQRTRTPGPPSAAAEDDVQAVSDPPTDAPEREGVRVDDLPVRRHSRSSSSSSSIEMLTQSQHPLPAGIAESESSFFLAGSVTDEDDSKAVNPEGGAARTLGSVDDSHDRDEADGENPDMQLRRRHT